MSTSNVGLRSGQMLDSTPQPQFNVAKASARPAGEKWPKDNYRSKSHFLGKHGLKMHDEVDREEGMLVAREFIEQHA